MGLPSTKRVQANSTDYSRRRSIQRYTLSCQSYASVSKPVTAMIVLQLLQEGKILSLDDDIGVYHSRYKNAVPVRARGGWAGCGEGRQRLRPVAGTLSMAWGILPVFIAHLREQESRLWQIERYWADRLPGYWCPSFVRTLLLR